MSNFSYLLERLSETYHQLSKLDLLLKKNPGDIGLLMSYESVKSMADQLECEWESVAQTERKEICQYRLSQRDNDIYTASGVSKSLDGFQSVLSHLFSALKNGPSKSGKLPAGLVEETSLQIGYSYPGSLGLSLYVESDKDLFGSKFEDTIEKLNWILGIESTRDLHEIASELGLSVIRKVHLWAKYNLANEYDLSLQWNSISGEKIRQNVEVETWDKIISMVNETNSSETTEFKVIGTLLNFSVAKTKKFLLRTVDGNEYAGYLSDDFETTKPYTVNKNYTAHIKTERITHYSEEASEEKHTLLNLVNFEREATS